MIDLYFNMYKIRYSKLDELINENKINIKNGKCNLFINIEPILLRLCDPKVDEYLRVANGEKNFQIISNIINLIAHYRLFFSKNKIHSKIYIYYQQPDTTKQCNQTYIPSYRKFYTARFTNGAVNYILMDTLVNSYSIIKLILEYVDGVYMIDPCGIESSLVPLVITQYQNDNTYTNFLLSDSPYDFQYVNHGFNILVSKQDKSRLLTSSNIMDELSSWKGVDFSCIKPMMIPFIISIVGDKVRNIYGIKGMGFVKTAKMITSAISRGVLTPDMDNINLLIQIIKDTYRDTLRTNYQCVNITNQYSDLSHGFIYQIIEQIVDKFDNESLKELNDRYFIMYPIQIMELTSKPKDRNQINF